MTDPVCHIPPVTRALQPDPRALPSIPAPTPTIEGLIATVQAMRKTILILTGQQGSRGPRGAAGKDANAKGQWQENRPRRVMEKVKIYSKSDPTQFVEVEQVNTIVMDNKDTKQTWIWRR